MKKYLFLLTVLIGVILSITFISAQQSLSAQPWGDNDNHEVWHSGQDIKVKIGDRYFSLQRVISHSLQFLTGVLPSSLNQTADKTFVVKEANSQNWKKICTTSEDY